MGTTNEKLSYLNTTKTKIKEALNLGGANITDDTFRSYADEIKDRYLYFMNNGTQEVWNNWDKVSGTGTTLSLNNTEEAPMKLEYKGNTSQNGTPTPSSPVNVDVVSGDNTINVSGKNLAYTNWASDFVSRINDNTKAKLQTEDNRNCLFFTANAGYNEYDTKYMFKTNWKTNTQYTFSFDMKSTANAGNIAIAYTDGTTQTFGNLVTANIWSKAVMTSTANKTIKYLQAYWVSGSGFIDLDTFMIEEGNQATTYEEYKSASYPINVGELELCKIGTYQDKIDKSTGKNFANINNIDNISSSNFNLTISNNTITISNNQNTAGYTNSGKKLSQICPSLKVGDTVYLFFDTTSTTTNKNMIYIGETWGKNGSKTITQTMLDSNVVFYGGYNETAVISNFIITKENDSTYEPYGTGWYLKKEIGKVVLDGSETWTHVTVTQGELFRNQTVITNDIKTDNKYVPLSNYYKGISYYNQGQRTNNTFYISSDNDILDIIDDRYTTDTDFKTWLASNNVSVYYVLANPTYETITDTTLIGQLEAIKKSYESQTNISQVNNDLPFELSVTALEVMS